MKENWFKQGTRIMMLIHRNKDGGPKRTDRESYRLISHDEKKFDENFEILLEEKNKSDSPLRIYSSVNERDFIKGVRLLRIQQIEIESQSLELQISFYMQLRNQFLSCLAKPQCATSKYFLIDLDSLDPLILSSVSMRLEEVTSIIDIRKTPQGWHIITKPYNPALTPDLEIKKDAMILLSW